MPVSSPCPGPPSICMNICELILGSDRAFVLFLDRFDFFPEPLSLLLPLDEVCVVLGLLVPLLLALALSLPLIGLPCMRLCGDITPLPEWSRSEMGVFRKLSKGLLLMSNDFLGGFRCGNGGGMSGLCICWECLWLLLLLLFKFFLPAPLPGATPGGEKALPILVLLWLCEALVSISLSFLRVPRLSEDRERGNRERKAGVEWCTGVVVGGELRAFKCDDLVCIGAKD